VTSNPSLDQTDVEGSGTRPVTHPGSAMNLPTGSTARLELPPLAAEHASGLVAAFADPSFRAFVPDEPDTLEGMLARIARIAAGPPQGGAGEVWLNFAVLLAGRPIGRIEATVQATGVAEIAYLIGPSAGGRGLATEAVEWLVDFVRETWPGIDIYACIAEPNVRSRRLVERLGFRETSPIGVPLLSYAAGDVVFVMRATPEAS
jgi:RimJ/RimL family protein N-acetyltransferase